MTTTRRPLLVIACLLGLLASPVAAAAPPADPATHRARELFNQGEKQYSLSRFAEALASYEQAYEAKPLAGLLFNIGQCHRQLGHWDQAAHAYRSYLEQLPAAKNREVVVGLIADMDAKPKEAAPVAVTPPVVPGPVAVVVAPPEVARPEILLPPPPPAPPAKPAYRRWYVWAAVGGVALAGVGLGLGLGLTQQPALPMGSLSSIDARGMP